MIRTRDFVLFLITLVFLLVLIVSTISRSSQNTSSSRDVSWDQTQQEQITAIATDDSTFDRNETIERLRYKLAQSEERIEPAVSVEEPDIEEVVLQGEKGTLQRCLYPDDALSIVPRWPLKDVSVSIVSGKRTVSQQITSIIPSAEPVGTSTVAVDEVVQITNIPLLQLPIVPLKASGDSCVPSEVVGVTKTGILMFNGDVNSYREVGPDTHIGFARDGFPIYGVYTGEVDTCGGYDHPQGYRYTISLENNYILGCYVGSPASFSL